MVVLDPLKITIDNYPHSKAIDVPVPNFPNKPELGSHSVTFDKIIYIERNDFAEVIH